MVKKLSLHNFTTDQVLYMRIGAGSLAKHDAVHLLDGPVRNG